MSDNKPVQAAQAEQTAQSRPERYEDVIGPVRRKWHEALASLTTSIDHASRAVDLQNERLDRIDETLNRSKSFG